MAWDFASFIIGVLAGSLLYDFLSEKVIINHLIKSMRKEDKNVKDKKD